MPETRKKVLYWPRQLKKAVTAYLSTEIGLSTCIAVLSVFLITLILCGRYLSVEDLAQADISQRTVYAERTLEVENVEETERSRYEARQVVAPIYKALAGSDRRMMSRLVDFLNEIAKVRNNSDFSVPQKQEALKTLLGAQQNASPEVMSTLLNTPNWQKFYQVSLETTESLINRGVRSEEYQNKRESIIRASLPARHGLNSSELDALVFVVGQKLRPTLVIDQRSTEEARNIAASQVKPVIEVYHPGDLIAREGEQLTELQRSALREQGALMTQHPWLAIVGISILSISLLSIVWIYLYRFEHSNFFRPNYAGLLATLMVTSVTGLVILLDLQPFWAMEFFPIGILSLMVCLFTHPRIAILTTMMLLLLCGIALKIPLESLSVLVISSMVGILVLARKPVPKDRLDLILAGLGIGVSRGLVILALSFIYDTVDITGVNNLFRTGVGFLSGILTGILTLGILPIAESWFKLVTPFTLLELGNHDRPLLRRMQMEAPGTFHHSLMVATLAESAAEAIGANPVLARVGSLYHDIGKMKRPLFFVENQAYFGVENPHDKLTPRLSKMVITAHPRDGVEMGKQLGLPKAIIRFMPEHHGTLVAGYFYNQAVLEEGEENVNKAQFRYPGPKPHSKETAIVMMADACESAVRALKNPTVTQVEERVDKIIKQRIDDGQFSECPITLQDIQIVRDTFIRILRGIQHNRIEYQQNVLEELGKKNSLDLLTRQMLNPAEEGAPAAKPDSSVVTATNGNPKNTAQPQQLSPTEKEILAEFEEQKKSGPECC